MNMSITKTIKMIKITWLSHLHRTIFSFCSNFSITLSSTTLISFIRSGRKWRMYKSLSFLVTRFQLTVTRANKNSLKPKYPWVCLSNNCKWNESIWFSPWLFEIELTRNSFSAKSVLWHFLILKCSIANLGFVFNPSKIIICWTYIGFYAGISITFRKKIEISDYLSYMFHMITTWNI